MQLPENVLRRQETQYFLNLLASGGSIAIVGPAGMGKTTLLGAVSQSLIQLQSLGQTEECEFVIVLLNVDVAQHCVPGEIFPAILDYFSSHNSEESRGYKAGVISAFECVQQRRKNGVSKYHKHQALLRNRQPRDARLILLIDDIETILQLPAFAEAGQFLGQLRAAGTTGNVSFLFTSRVSLHALHLEQALNRGSPTFNFVREFRLEPLDKTQSLKYFADWQLSSSTIEPLIELAGGNPTLLRTLRDIVLSSTATEPSMLKIAQRLVQEASPYLEKIWDDWTPAQRALMTAIAEAQAMEEHPVVQSSTIAIPNEKYRYLHDLDWLTSCGWVVPVARDVEMFQIDAYSCRPKFGTAIHNNEITPNRFRVQPPTLLWWLWSRGQLANLISDEIRRLSIRRWLILQGGRSAICEDGL